MSEWYEKIGDVYLAQKELGDSLPAAQALRDSHAKFEREARVCIALHRLLMKNLALHDIDIRPPSLSRLAEFAEFLVSAEYPPEKIRLKPDAAEFL